VRALRRAGSPKLSVVLISFDPDASPTLSARSKLATCGGGASAQLVSHKRNPLGIKRIRPERAGAQAAPSGRNDDAARRGRGDDTATSGNDRSKRRRASTPRARSIHRRQELAESAREQSWTGIAAAVSGCDGASAPGIWPDRWWRMRAPAA
jgi:hypothetical protein